MMMKAQMDLVKAQTAATNADANLKNVDAAKKAGVDTENVKADTANKIAEQVIKDYTGKDLKDVYERIKVPNRGIEEKTWQDELSARQAVADNMIELWTEGKLKEKSNAEIESILIDNAKNRAEEKRIYKIMDLIDEEIKGQKLSNILADVEAQWATGTGLKSGNVIDVITKVLGALVGIKMGNKPTGKGITINNYKN